MACRCRFKSAPSSSASSNRQAWPSMARRVVAGGITAMAGLPQPPSQEWVGGDSSRQASQVGMPVSTRSFWVWPPIVWPGAGQVIVWSGVQAICLPSLAVAGQAGRWPSQTVFLSLPQDPPPPLSPSPGRQAGRQATGGGGDSWLAWHGTSLLLPQSMASISSIMAACLCSPSPFHHILISSLTLSHQVYHHKISHNTSHIPFHSSSFIHDIMSFFARTEQWNGSDLEDLDRMERTETTCHHHTCLPPRIFGTCRTITCSIS